MSPQQRRVILAGVAGNVMEWYDFAVYGYFASIIGAQFFPSHDATASLLAAFGVFAAGFLMRPLGALVFGHIGDRMGRRAALLMSVLAMAVPTFLIGLLPDYERIGVAASAALVALRLVQGLSVGGEYTTSIIFLVESAPPERRGFLGSWSAFGAVAGILCGSAVAAFFTALMPAAELHAWGWRLPFLIGLAVGLAGLYVRGRVPEQTGQAHAASRPPIVDAFRTQLSGMLRVIGLNAGPAVAFYLLFVYLVTYLTQIVHVNAPLALEINTFNMVVLLAVLVSAGVLSDRVGRRPLLVGGALGLVVLGWPLFSLLHSGEPRLILLAQLCFAVLVGAFVGALPAAMVELFPRRVRCSAVSVAYNVSVGLIGGTTPIIATYLVERTGNEYAPALYLIGMMLITLAVAWRLPETANQPLPDAVAISD
ncbi:MAG: MFS transporter [Candidatus Binatia bacterium]